MKRVTKVACLTLISYQPALAEVMDKEPTLTDIWLGAGAGTALAFVAGRAHPFLGVLGVFQIMNPAFVALTEVYDRLVGPAIEREAGMSYIVQVQAANLVVVLGYLLGILFWRRARRPGGRAPRDPEVVRA